MINWEKLYKYFKPKFRLFTLTKFKTQLIQISEIQRWITICAFLGHCKRIVSDTVYMSGNPVGCGHKSPAVLLEIPITSFELLCSSI